MAQHSEPMDVDMDSEFDNKENSYQHSNVLPSTEKGYEELDVSELNMKLRYSITPANSPMSKSYSAYVDNRHLDTDESLNCNNENANLTRSLNSTMTNDSVIKSLKSLPLQTILSEQGVDNISSVLRQLDSTLSSEVTVTVSGPTDIDESLSRPSSSSSTAHTPEATTPTNITKNEEGSPILRGLKSVFNMFRSSQSPIPPDNDIPKQEASDLDATYFDQKSATFESTPTSASNKKENISSRRNSPLKDSITFNEDLEKHLQWEEDTVFFSDEKIPIHKLFLPNLKLPSGAVSTTPLKEQKPEAKLNTSVENMDISYNDSVILDCTITGLHNGGESDGEFLDCETTFTKNESQDLENMVAVNETINQIVTEIDLERSLQSDPKERTRATAECKHVSDNCTLNAKDGEDILNSEPRSEKEGNMIINLTSVDNLNTNNDKPENTKEIIQDDSVNEDNISNIVNISVDILSNINSTFNKNTDNDVSSKIPEILPTELQILNSNESLILESSNESETSEFVSPNIENVLLQKQANDTINITSEIKLNTTFDGSNDNANNITSHKMYEITSTTTSDILNYESHQDSSFSNEVLQNENKLNTSLAELKDNANVTTHNIDELITKLQQAEHVNEENSANNNSEAQIDIPNTDVCSENANVLNVPISNFKDSMILPQQEYQTNVESSAINSESPKNGPNENETLENEQPFEQKLETESTHLNISELTVSINPNHESVEKFIQLNNETIVLIPNQTVLMNAVESNETNESINNGKNIQNTDILNETNDIVNSLTEIIGESPNNTVCLLDQSQNCEMDGIECSNEKQPLPDLVNQSVSQIQVISDSEIDTSLPITCDDNPNINDIICTVLTPDMPLVTNVTEDVKEEETIENIKLEPELQVIRAVEEDNTTNFDLKVINDATIDDEIVISGNNSPYVSVIAESVTKQAEESFEKIDIMNNTYQTPSSPPIKSKGYNFNFDEMDDPFATKTKLSLSPPKTVDKTKGSTTNKETTTLKSLPNRRRSQPPERKRSTVNKKKLNNTFDAREASRSLKNNDVKTDNKLELEDTIEVLDENIDVKLNESSEKNQEKIQMSENVASDDCPMAPSTETKKDGDNETTDDCLDASPKLNDDLHQQNNVSITKTSSDNQSSAESATKSTTDIKSNSSELSTYFSAGSSSDSSISKNVFNLPEIDDKNFNPFATKTKMRLSPVFNKSPSINESMVKSSHNSFSSQIEKDHKIDKEEKMDMDKDTSYNVSNSTSSSKATIDKNLTTREINTEDEDTEEGPFMEAEDVDNFMDMDDSNMMRFNELAAEFNEEKADAGEMFIDAQAYEFLLNQNKCSSVADSGKESLFLKFDPLFAKRMSAGGDILAALSQVKKRQSTPSKPIRPSLRNEASPIAGPSNMNSTFDAETNITQDSVEDLNITVAKPMMVVTPAVNAAVTPRNKTTTPPRSNRRSINFTSPAMAVIDRLLSLSGNNSLLGHDTTATQTNTNQSETDLALTQLRELLAEKEISVYQLRTESKELKDRLSVMETQVKILESDGEDRIKKLNDLNDRLVEKTTINKRMAAVVEEYERTIASLIAETEQDKKRHNEERIRLINERDEQTAHLASMEVSFSDLHSKYEKSKQIILSCKANEDACEKSNKDFEENLAKMQANYEALKQHATSKLNNANQELQKITKAHETEVLKLNALIKRKDMHITSLEETLAQKTKANEELTAICDELINKVG